MPILKVIWKNIREISLKPNFLTLNNFVIAFGSNALLQDMKEVLEYMKSKNYTPPTMTYNHIIRFYGKEVRFRKLLPLSLTSMS
jgi:hypothetical protein